MTEPTLESMNEAARAVGYKDWSHTQSSGSLQWPSIRAHALTLDKLHGRKEVSEAEEFYREVVALRLGHSSLWDGDLDAYDREAIALIEHEFEARGPKWTEWAGGECPVAPEAHVEIKMCNGDIIVRKAGSFNWKHAPPLDRQYYIIAYRLMR